MERVKKGIGAVVLMVVAVLGGASAPEVKASDIPDKLARAGGVCMIRVDPVQPGARMSRIWPEQCYATYAEAEAAMAGIAARVTETATPGAAPGPSTRNGYTVLGYSYQHINYGGWQKVWYTPSGGCICGRRYFFNVPSHLNDQFSSAWLNPSSRCFQFIHYQLINRGGPRVICDRTNNCRNLVARGFNDVTSSVEFR